jgi:hypothetical protein
MSKENKDRNQAMAPVLVRTPVLAPDQDLVPVIPGKLRVVIINSI